MLENTEKKKIIFKIEEYKPIIFINLCNTSNLRLRYYFYMKIIKLTLTKQCSHDIRCFRKSAHLIILKH